MKLNKLTSILSISATALLLGAPMAQAVPFTITSTLIGDPRPVRLDNIIVDVTITGDTTSNQTFWTVDLNSPIAHPDMRLGGFFFNLAGAAGDYIFSNFSPSNWSISTPVTNATASGGADFMFGANRTPPGGIVTNTLDLTFTATKNSSNWLVTDFTSALSATSNNTFLGSGQLGAHLQRLTIAGNCGAFTNCSSKSGFAMGSYVVTQGPRDIPEPMSLLLIGAGLFGFAAVRRCRLV